MTLNSDNVKDLLLEDYRYRAEAMKNSEQAGETRHHKNHPKEKTFNSSLNYLAKNGYDFRNA